MAVKNDDIRWHQRFISFSKAFSQLERFIAEKELNELEERGLLKEKGYNDILGPKPVIEQSFQDGYITKGKEWLRMHNSRNLTSHTYDKETADEIIVEIRESYFDLLKDLYLRLSGEKAGMQKSIFDE